MRNFLVSGAIAAIATLGAVPAAASTVVDNIFDFRDTQAVQGDRPIGPTIVANTGISLNAAGTIGGLPGQVRADTTGAGVGNAFVESNNQNVALDESFSVTFDRPGFFKSLTINVKNLINPGFAPNLRVDGFEDGSGGRQVVFFAADPADPDGLTTYDINATVGPGLLESRFEFFTTDTSAFQVTAILYQTEGDHTPIPLPAGAWLMLSGLGILAGYRHFQRT